MITWIRQISVALMSICVTVIFTAVFLDFTFFHKERNVEKEKRTIVETGSMMLFFLVYYAILMIGWGRVSFNEFWDMFFSVIGWIPLVGGCVINVVGRIYLGRNWANQIKIYKKHQLIIKGPYSYVRHPLYSSIIMMLIGGSFIYHDILTLILTVTLFIPMMVYRGKQEEKLLKMQFQDYDKYQKNVGRLFPKIFSSKKWRNEE